MLEAARQVIVHSGIDVIFEGLDEWVAEADQFNVLWPASRQMTPKLRAFVAFMAQHLPPQ